MHDEDEAKHAISELNGYDLDGMNLKVEVSEVDWQRCSIVKCQSSRDLFSFKWTLWQKLTWIVFFMLF